MPPGGPVVPGYADLVILGRGGFATVYRARQLAFDREVALKVLDGAHTDARTIQLFTRECRAAGSLSWHPHVVVVHDAGTTDRGTPFLAMELLPGGSLADRLATSGPLPVADAVQLTGEVASALAAAHEADLLHRDVKPANVLVDRLGRAKLADFGIARLVGAGSATTTGAVTGTVAYMAPEVLKGGKASPASDVYALGLTLLTLLVGRNPLSSDSDDSPFVVIARVISGEPLAIPPDLPPEVRGLIEVCTDHEPTARPSAADVAARLAGLVPPPATPPPPPPPAVAAPASPPLPKGVVPPPPTSAVRVRADHTLAEAPAPAAPLDPPTAVADATATQVAPPPSGPARSRRGLVLGAVALVAVALLAGAIVWLTRESDGEPTTVADATSTTTDGGDGGGDTTSPTSTVAATIPSTGGPPGVVRTLDLGEDTGGLAVEPDGTLWISRDLDEGTVDAIDPATGEEVGSGPAGVFPDDLAIGEEGLWALSGAESTVTGVDPATGEPLAAHVLDTATGALAVGEGALWVATDQGAEESVLKVDPATGEVLASAPAGAGPQALAVGEGAVWGVADPAGTPKGTLTRIDAGTGGVTATLDIDYASGVVVGGGAVWIVDPVANVLSRIDPTSVTVTGTAEVGLYPAGLAFGAGAVWVVDSDLGTVSRVDPDSLEVTDTIEVEPEATEIVASDASIWVANVESGRVWQIVPD